MIKQTIVGFFLLSSILILFSFQQKDQVFEQIRNAFLDGNADNLALFFNKNLELKLDGYQADYSQVQAVYILKDFFEEFPPKTFKYSRQESFKENLIYLVGTYQSIGDEFQICMMVQEIDGGHIIGSLDIIHQ